MREVMTSPSSTMVPLRLINPDLHVSDGSFSENRQLAAVPSSTFTGASGFRLPKSWTVRLALRSDGTRVDKYYYEPDTNKMCRSIREVERYLNGEDTPRHRSPNPGYQPKLTMGGFGSEKMTVSRGRSLRLEENDFVQGQLGVVSHITSTAFSPFNLPDGWVVEMRPRKGQGCDKYYYEPGTGQKFRSLAAVERYLQAEKIENAPVSHMFEMGNSCKDYNPKKRKGMGALASDLIEPPKKIKWVLKNSSGLAWDPLVGETHVPDPVKNQWSFRFMQLTSKNGKTWKS